jgi:type IV fimbrial biogenesis protein FimT
MKHIRQRGVTLLELLTALVMVSVLLAMAVPSFRNFTRNNRVTAAQNDLVTALNLARSESLRRSQPVAVCSTTDGATCGTVNDWQTGWIVFVDQPGGVTGALDAGEQIVQVWRLSSTEAEIKSTNPYVEYRPTGEATGAFGLDVSPHQHCAAGQKQKRRTLVSGSGSLTTSLVDCALDLP